MSSIGVLPPPGRVLAGDFAEMNSAAIRSPLGTQRHDLAVEPRSLYRQLRQVVGQVRQALGPVEISAANQRHRASVDPAEHAVAVEFDFMKPERPVRGGLAQSRELRRDA